MDPLDLLADNFRPESLSSPTTAIDVAGCFSSPEKVAQMQGEEEKREDNLTSDSSSDKEIDFPNTQVLVQEESTTNKQPPMNPVSHQSPIKEHTSPIRPCNVPIKPRSSPDKARSSPDKLRSSPIEVQLSMKDRLPAEPLPLSVKDSKAPAAPSLIVDKSEDDDTPEEFQAKGAEGKFTKVFPAISKLLESSGWQIAQGMNTLFCAMPGVQFYNFKPNINVFDSKLKACWKYIEIAGKEKRDQGYSELWDLLWPIAEKKFQWFTMACRSETWYVEPGTKFENFIPNETVFQSKKRAVLKCLAVEVGEIKLGESAEGHQIVSFAPRAVQPKPASAVKKAKASLFKTPSPALKTVMRTTPSSTSSTHFVTPAKQASVALATSGDKRKLTSSAASSASGAKRKLSSSPLKATKSSDSTKKLKAGKVGTKKVTTNQKTNKVIPTAVSDVSKADVFKFSAPEFRCSFGVLYAKLQDEGWYHKSGVFEYDYFSPTYTDTTKEINVNYFRSQADLEDFLKVSGTWKRIEDELRLEYELAVEEEREKALEKHHQRLEQQATRKRNLALYGQPAVQKTKKVKKTYKKTSSASLSDQSRYQGGVEAAQAAGVEKHLLEPSNIKFGTVLKKLVARGWYYRPGRFEYDYFKPSANPKTAVSGEDRFESASALEIYLKTTGLWEQIAEEVAHEKVAECANPYTDRPGRRNKLESPHLASAFSPKSANGASEKEDVKAITNDIWANSHEFDFNE